MDSKTPQETRKSRRRDIDDTFEVTIRIRKYCTIQYYYLDAFEQG